RGVLIAWDPIAQKERWRVQGGGGIGGGTVTTAGNIVFQVVPDGRLMAYSADKGEKLLEIQTGLKGGMGPPTTYPPDGKQCVRVAGATGPVVFRPRGGGGGGGRGAGAPPAPAPAAGGAAPTEPGAATGASTSTITPKLLTFVLDGK